MYDKDDNAIYVEIATKYYIYKMTQQEIAIQYGMSRSNVSRILTQCLSNGIVEINVKGSLSLFPNIAKKIELAYSLDEVIICATSPVQERTYNNLGVNLAKYFLKTVDTGSTVGVTKGRTGFFMARALENRNLQPEIVQMMGYTSNISSYDEGAGLVMLLASKLNGRAVILNTPLMVRSKQAKELLLQSEMIESVFEKLPLLDVAILNIERANLYSSEPLHLHWLTRADILQLGEVGAVASMCGYYYDKQGKACNTGINDRVMSFDPQLLSASTRKLGVSIGRNSLSAVLSILHTKLLNVLFIDEQLAFEISDTLDKRLP